MQTKWIVPKHTLSRLLFDNIGNFARHHYRPMLISPLLKMLAWDVNVVRDLIEIQQLPYDLAIQHLNGVYNTSYAPRTLRLFCKDHDIHRVRPISDTELDSRVQMGVALLGPDYGRKTMKGFLAGNMGTSAAEHRIGNSLKRVHPGYAEMRMKRMKRQVHPPVYVCAGFGQNLHIDQNEKPVHWGVVMTIAIDGYSSFIPGSAVMGAKSNLSIYRNMIRPIVQRHGVFRKIYADHGREFYLTGFMQQYFTYLTRGHDAVGSSFIQTKSTSNVRVERCWVEVNRRIGYPLRNAFMHLEGHCGLDKDNEHHLYSMSIIGQWLVRYALSVWIPSWNSHPIEGRWIPVCHVNTNVKSIPLSDQFILSTEQAAILYRQKCGVLADERPAVGKDYLERHPYLQQLRDAEFCNIVVPQLDIAVSPFFGKPSNAPVSDHERAAYVFGNLVNGRYKPFELLTLAHVRLSERIFNQFGRP